MDHAPCWPCQASAARLGRPVDLYQIHFPGAWANAAYWDGLGDAYDQGIVKAVGVSNYGSDALRAAHAALAARGIPLASNQALRPPRAHRIPRRRGR
jgi:pyridoxine 4-dehydrogenase